MKKIKHHFKDSGITVEVNTLVELKKIADALGEKMNVAGTVNIQGKGLTLISSLDNIELMKQIRIRLNDFLHSVTIESEKEYDKRQASYFLARWTNKFSDDDTLHDLWDEINKRAEVKLSTSKIDILMR